MRASSGATAERLFGIDLPIILGPMAGGPSTPELTAAVSNAGGLGSLGEGYASPDQILHDIRSVRSRCAKPFAVNLFVPEQVIADEAVVERALRAIAPYREELGLPPQVIPTRFAEDFPAQLDVIRTEGVPVFTFTFGLLPAHLVEDLQRSGTVVGGTATTPAEAEALVECGVDFVIAQGSEAGGHRGSFLVPPGDDLIGLAALVPQIKEVTRVPVVAAGGIINGRGISAALILGACAGQLGTAFLLCPEAGTSAPYRQEVRRARAEDTVITSAFSGRRARGVVNRFSRDLAGRTDLPPYPVMNALTREMRQVAAELGNSDLLALWAGQGVGAVRELPAAKLVDRLAHESAIAQRE